MNFFKNKKTKNLILIATILVFSGLVLQLFPFLFSQRKTAQAQDVQCISQGLAEYVAEVFEGLGATQRYNNIYLLSPAFNMTNPNFSSFVNQFAQELNSLGYGLDSFYAIAGNAYNMEGGRIEDWVGIARNTSIGGQTIILTEIGFYPPDNPPGGRDSAINQLQQSISNLKADSSIEAALLFNVFGLNPSFGQRLSSDHATGHALTDNEIQTVCGGNCGKIGANSAVFYSSSADIFYQPARSFGMDYTLEIAGGPDVGGVIGGINSAHALGMTPIVRFGTRESSSGMENPQTMVEFIQQLSSQTTGKVYVIIGPNEPLSECWATPECGCETISPPPSAEWPVDPTNFYLEKEKNEDLYLLANQLYAQYMSQFGEGGAFPFDPFQSPLFGGEHIPGDWQRPISQGYCPVTGYCITDTCQEHLARNVSCAWDFATCQANNIVPVYPILDGTIAFAQCGWNWGYGCLVIINHGYNEETGWCLSSRYAHLSQLYWLSWQVGQEVNTATRIGYVNDTGISTGPHLHFEIRWDTPTAGNQCPLDTVWPPATNAIDPERIFGPPSPRCSTWGRQD